MKLLLLGMGAGIVATVCLLWGRTPAVALLALVVEPRQKVLSLGRSSLLAFTVAVVAALVVQPQALLQMGAPASAFLCVVFLTLAAYNYGTKQHVKDVICALAGRCAAPSSAPIVTEAEGGTDDTA